MKRFIIYIISNLVSLVVLSQVVYFNNRYESVTNLWNGSVSIVELNNEYLIGGTTGHSNNNFWHQISLIKMDFEGNTLIEKIIGDTIAERDISIGSLSRKDNEIYFSGTHRQYTSEWVHDCCMIVKLDENLETVWTKYFGEIVEPYDTSYLSRHLALIPNDGFMIVGSKSPYGLPSKILVIKIDDLGNKMWEKTIGTGSFFYQGFSAIQTTDNGYAIGGYRFIIGQNETADPIIYKTDSLGNLEWEKNLGGPFFDYYPMLTLGNNGNIIVGTCYADSMSTPNSGYSRINIVKLDNQGNVLWNKKYGQSITYNFLKQIITTSDGSYVASGHVKNNYPHISSWIIKIAENGDSIFYRQYDNLLGPQSENRLFDIIQTSDNGFATCGYVFPMLPDTGSQDAWVLKVDSMGCDTPGCITTVISEELMVIENIELVVWPNPTSGMFSVQCSEFCVEGEKVIKIYNSQGIKVEEVKGPENAESLQIDASKYSNGLYYLQYIHSNQIIETTKFIKN